MEKVEGPNYQALKKQLLEELRPETKKPMYTDEDFSAQRLKQIELQNKGYETARRSNKIEQLRRNIENTSRFASEVFGGTYGAIVNSSLHGDKDLTESAKEFKKMQNMLASNLSYYVEKLKEETEEMLKE